MPAQILPFSLTARKTGALWVGAPGRADAVKAALKQLNRDWVWLARKCDCQPDTLRKFIRGRNFTANRRRTVLLCRALGITENDLIFGV